MKDYKVAQEYYHRMTPPDEIGDFNCGFFMVADHAIAETTIEYLTKEYPHADLLPQPTKTYAVALIYAKLLEKHFSEDFYEVLSDPDLLYGNAKWFVPYSPETARTYDRIIKAVPEIIRPEISQTQATITYFEKEFLLI